MPTVDEPSDPLVAMIKEKKKPEALQPRFSLSQNAIPFS
jgi:hypothetical protein